MSDNFFALGLGIGTRNKDGNWLEVYFPQPVIKPSAATVAAFRAALDAGDGQQVLELAPGQLSQLESALRSADDSPQADIVKALKTSEQAQVAVLLASDEPPTTVAEAYLKLQLLSHRLPNPTRSISMASSRYSPTLRGPTRAPSTWRSCHNANCRHDSRDNNWRSIVSTSFHG